METIHEILNGDESYFPILIRMQDNSLRVCYSTDECPQGTPFTVVGTNYRETGVGEKNG